jgi:ceramide glucosyltransferase
MDSNVTVAPSGLLSAISIFEEDLTVGLVHHIPAARNVSTFGGLLDGLFMNTTHGRMYSGINSLGSVTMVIGKSNLYRKSSLDKLGGLAAFAKFMAEDNEIALGITSLGLRNQIAPETAFQSMGSYSFKDFILRRVRWIRIRKSVVPLATLVEPLSEAFLCTLIASVTISPYFDPVVFSKIQLSVWFVSDFACMIMLIQPTSKHDWALLVKMIICWPIEKLFALALWVLGISGDQILWRGQFYHCNPDGTGSLISSKTK